MTKNKERTSIVFLVVLTLCIFISGCSKLGVNSILFVTKTSLGVDIDSSPPAIDIGYNRKEGTIAPVFENGQVLSQLAGFSTKQGFINQAAGQSFATGNAAELMSKYLISNASVTTGETIPIADVENVQKLTKKSEPKRYFFGTDTSFGLKVNLNIESGGIPNALSIGYKRKELAYVPLIEKDIGNNSVEVALPSLIATAGFDNKISANDSNLYLNQFFATGKSANYLAAIPGIRQTVVPKMIPESKALIDYARGAEFTEKSKQVRIEKIILLVDSSPENLIYQLNQTPPVPDPQADILIPNMDLACQRLATRDCDGNGTPDTGGAAAVGDLDIAKRMLKFRVVLSGSRTEEELNAWEAALKSGKQ